MNFLVDANLGRKFTSLLNEIGHDAVFIKDIMPAATDDEILNIAENEDRLVITNDLDFGELVFKSNRPTKGIMLLRTFTANSENRFELIKNILDKAKGKFIVVREDKIRIQEL